MSEGKTAYPLCWPAGRPRTKSYAVARSRFDTTFARARTNIVEELDRLGTRNTILSTNIELRLDGLPYANRAEPSDRGAAIYFTHKGRQMAFACDRWDKVGDNIHAIALTIGALRGISRWGTGDMMEAAFTGFAALPSSIVTPVDWRNTLGCPDARTLEDANAAYKRARSEAHPDRGGTQDRFIAINNAWAQAEAELGLQGG